MALPAGYPNAVAVTPSDTVPVVSAGVGGVALPFAAIYVGGAGNVAVTTVGGQNVTFTAPPVGSVLYIRATHVRSTGTTATALVAMY